MSRRERFEVAADEAGMRLDQVLAKRVEGLSRRKARVLVDLGGVFVDRARVKVASRALRAGQQVEAVLGGALDRATGEVGHAARDADAAMLPDYQVVFEDDELVIVDKPAGLVTAPTPESDRGNLLDLLARRPGAAPVFLVHRIDRDTSGLLVFAHTPDANRALGARFAAHDVERAYVAVVAGHLEGDPSIDAQRASMGDEDPAGSAGGAGGEATRTIDRPIRGKRAVSHVQVEARLADATRVGVRLETGRSHQIRIHLAGLGHPVLGDTQHGGEVARTYPRRPPRLALHAAVLGIVHPRTGETLRFESPLPDDLATWLATIS